MDGSAIKEIERIIRTTAEKISSEGKSFIPAGYQEVKRTQLGHSTYEDLSALVDAFTSVKSASEEAFITVSEDAVTASIRDFDGSIVKFASVQAKVTEFSFDEFMDVTSMRISLMTMFDETEDRTKLMVYLSKITAKTEIDWSDDGASTKITVSDGVSGQIMDAQQFSSILSLKPFRTFFDVEQPTSKFLFRLEKKGDKVTAALFDINTGYWKYEARTNIRKRLIQLNPEIGKFIR